MRNLRVERVSIVICPKRESNCSKSDSHPSIRLFGVFDVCGLDWPLLCIESSLKSFSLIRRLKLVHKSNGLRSPLVFRAVAFIEFEFVFLNGKKGVCVGVSMRGDCECEWDESIVCVVLRRVAGNEAKYLAIREKFEESFELRPAACLFESIAFCLIRLISELLCAWFVWLL